MAQYTKHNSNYIKTNIHQKLKDGSTIFEQDWATIGSQLHFGPGKIPYYTNGNFIFTTSPIPYYQKKYKNGVAVGLWTYDDVKTKLWSITPLSKMWSIGPRMERNLNKLGLYTVGDIITIK